MSEMTKVEYNRKYSGCHWSRACEVRDALFHGAVLQEVGRYDEDNVQFELIFTDGVRLVTLSTVELAKL